MSTSYLPPGTTVPVTLPKGVSPRFTLTKLIIGHRYPKNGNAHNPTPEVRWTLHLDGKYFSSSGSKRREVMMAREQTAEIAKGNL